MANTRDLTVKVADGWTLVAENPTALSITANTLGNWYVAVSDAGVPTVSGEKMDARGSYVTGAVQGTVYIRAASVNINPALAEEDKVDRGMKFGVTEEVA